MAIPNILSLFDRWLQESISSAPADFGLTHILKFCVACTIMLGFLYPAHRIAMPLIHESGHYLVAKIEGKTPPLFVVGNYQTDIWFDTEIGGTRFVISPKAGGSQVLLLPGEKTCATAAGGPLATLLVAVLLGILVWQQRKKPITIMYVIMLAVSLDATASTLVNLFSSLPGADGVYLRACLPF